MFSTDFKQDKPKVRKWTTILLVLSLSLNIFGLSWYVSHGVFESNLPIADFIKELKSQKNDQNFSELQLVTEITEKLSEEGARLVFTEYALRKPKLDRLIEQINMAQLNIKQELSKPTINDVFIENELKSVASLMANRLEIMTDLVAKILPRLSLEDREKITSSQ